MSRLSFFCDSELFDRMPPLRGVGVRIRKLGPSPVVLRANGGYQRGSDAIAGAGANALPSMAFGRALAGTSDLNELD